MMRSMIERESHDGITIVRMNRGKVNALDPELIEAISATFDEIDGPSTSAVVLTGSGSSFSAGVDLRRLLAGGVGYVKDFYPPLIRMFEKLYTFERPVVAAVNGHAIAGGCVLVQCCDYRLMASGTARIGVPELLVGVPFPTFVTELMRASVNRGNLQDILYSGRTLLPEEALRVGMIDETIDSETLLEAATDAARRLGNLSPRAFSITKRTLREETMERVRYLLPEETEVRALWETEETLVRIQDYLDRTIVKKKSEE